MEEVEKEEEEEGEVEEEGKEDLKTFLSECAHAALSVHACVYVFEFQICESSCNVSCRSSYLTAHTTTEYFLRGVDGPKIHTVLSLHRREKSEAFSNEKQETILHATL